jgi:hypothetical protein
MPWTVSIRSTPSFASQVANVDVDDVRAGVEAQTPHLVEELFA